MQKERQKSKRKESVKNQKSCAVDTKKFTATSVSMHKNQEKQHIHKRANTLDKKQSKKKNKVSKKKIEAQNKRFLDEQQRKQQQEQYQRQQQLQLLRLEQLKKLTKQETQRLQNEFPQYYNKCQHFQSIVMNSQKKQKQIAEWDNYLQDAEMIDIDKQKQMNKIILNMKQNLLISFNNQPFQKCLQFLQKIINQLKSRIIASKATNNFDKISYYQYQQNIIYENIWYKLEECVRYNIDNFETILQVKNKQLVQKNYVPLSLENEKIIHEQIFRKNQERYKYEIYRLILNNPILQFAIWFNLIKVGYRPKNLVFQQLNVELEVPRQFIQNNILVTCLKTINNRYNSISSQYKNLCEVIQIVGYPFFPLPRVNKRFILKKITQFEQTEQKNSSIKPVLKKVKLQLKETQKISIKISIPNYLYIGKNNQLTVGTYSEEGWTKKGIMNPQFDFKQNTVKFQTTALLPFSLMVPKTIDYPYKSFYLRSTSTQVALLDLQTKRLKLQFEIGRNYVKLISSSIPQLKFLLQTEYKFSNLLMELEKKGIIINPTDEDADYVAQSKISEVQNKVIEDLGFTISTFAFRNSTFNSQCQNSQIVVQCKIHLDFEPRDIVDDLNPWEKYFFNINKCGILNQKLKSFRQEYEPKNVAHINMQKAIRQDRRFNEQIGHRFGWVNLYPQFIINLKAFLKELKIFSLTV